MHQDPLVARIDRLLASGFTLTAIAEAAGVRRPNLSRWLLDRRQAPPTRAPIGERLEAALPGLERASRRARSSRRIPARKT